MKTSKYLEPAHTVIRTIGEGDLSRGIKVVSEICDLDRTRVYRWMRPRQVNGTDGRIDPKYQRALLRYVEAKGLPLSARDLIVA